MNFIFLTIFKLLAIEKNKLICYNIFNYICRINCEGRLDYGMSKRNFNDVGDRTGIFA